jgi:hypothetical protein
VPRSGSGKLLWTARVIRANFSKGTWRYDIKWVEKHKGCMDGKPNVPEDELSAATNDGELSEHETAAKNSLEDPVKVRAEYGPDAESIVLDNALSKLQGSKLPPVYLFSLGKIWR